MITEKQRQALELGRQKGLKRHRPKGLTYNIVKNNPTSFKKGVTPWNKGKPTGNKKEDAGYDALHEWVERWAGKPKICENCGTVTAKEYHWSNISHEYKRDLSDWMRLCKKCHFKYDRKTGWGLATKLFPNQFKKRCQIL